MANVFKCLGHLLHLASWEEVDGVPVPFVVDNVGVEVHRVVRGDQMMRECTLTSLTSGGGASC